MKDKNYNFEEQEEFMIQISESKQSILSVYKPVKRYLVYPFTYFVFDWTIQFVFEEQLRIKKDSILVIMNKLKLYHEKRVPLFKYYNEYTFFVHCFKYFYFYNASSMVIFFDKKRFNLNKKFLIAFSKKISALQSREFMIQYSILKRICDEMNVYLFNYKLDRRNDCERILIFLHIFYITYLVYSRFSFYEKNNPMFMAYTITNFEETEKITDYKENDKVSKSRPRIPSLFVPDPEQITQNLKQEKHQEILDKFVNKVLFFVENLGKKSFKLGVIKEIFKKNNIEEIYKESMKDIPIVFDQIIELCEYFSVKVIKTFLSFCKTLFKEIDLSQFEHNLKLYFLRGMLFYLKQFLSVSIIKATKNESNESLHVNIIALIEHFQNLEKKLLKLGFSYEDINLLKYLAPVFEKWIEKFYNETKEIISHIGYNNYSDQEHFDPIIPLSSTVDFANLLIEYSNLFSRIMKKGTTIDIFRGRLRDNITFLVKLFISQEMKIKYDGESFIPSYVMTKDSLKEFVELRFPIETIQNSQKVAQKAIIYINNIHFLEYKLKENDFYLSLLFFEGKNRYFYDAKNKLLNVLVQDTFHHILRPIVIEIFTLHLADESLNDSRSIHLNNSSRMHLEKIHKVRGVVKKVKLLILV